MGSGAGRAQSQRKKIAMKKPTIAVWTNKAKKVAARGQAAITGWTEKAKGLEDTARGHALRKWSEKAKAVATSDRLTQWSNRPRTRKPVDPLVILCGICLGIPLLVMLVMIGTNPAINATPFSGLAHVVTGIVVVAFIILAVWEVRRLAQLPDDDPGY